MNKILTIILFSLFVVLCGFNTSIASEGKIYIIDDFKVATQDRSEVVSNSRRWYSFGGISISADANGTLKAVSNLKTGGGFGIDPGPNGSKGLIIPTNGFDSIIIDIEGSAPSLKIELYDDKYNKYGIWVDLINKTQDGFIQKLPPEMLGKNISKLQFLCSQGKVNLSINSILLK